MASNEGSAGIEGLVRAAGPPSKIPRTSLLDYWLRDKTAIMKDPLLALQYVILQEGKIGGRIFQLSISRKMVVLSDHSMLMKILTWPQADAYVIKSSARCMNALKWNRTVLKRNSQYAPCQFLEGIPHQIMKTELTSALKLDDPDHVQESMQTVNTIVKDIFEKQWTEKGVGEFTHRLAQAITKGCKDDPDAASNITPDICESLSQITRRTGQDSLTMDALDKIERLVAHSGLLKSLCRHVGFSGDDDAMVQATFTLVCNMMIPLRCLLTNIICHWVACTAELQDELRSEVESQLVPGEIYETSLKNCPLLLAFVLEVLRLCPPQELFFWRAREALPIVVGDESYRIPANQEIVGNVFSAQRQEDVFAVEDLAANEFHPKRFIRSESLKGKLLWSHGGGSYGPQVDNHQCPAKNLTLRIGQIFLATLCRHDVELSSTPTWERWRPGCEPDQTNLAFRAVTARQPPADITEAKSASQRAALDSQSLAMKRKMEAIQEAARLAGEDLETKVEEYKSLCISCPLAAAGANEGKLDGMADCAVLQNNVVSVLSRLVGDLNTAKESLLPEGSPNEETSGNVDSMEPSQQHLSQDAESAEG